MCALSSYKLFKKKPKFCEQNSYLKAIIIYLLGKRFDFSIKFIQKPKMYLMKPSFLTVLALLGLKVVSSSSIPDQQEIVSQRWTEESLFYYGMMAGGFVSLIGFIAAFLLLCLRKGVPEYFYISLIQVLFALSCGALLGETMLHILPQAYASKHIKDQNASLIFIASIVSFIILERLMNRYGISHSHWHEDEQEGEINHRVLEKKQLEQKKREKNKNEKEATGFLNLISSLLHNFIDGLAIGLAFSLGNPAQFIPITVGIIAHEIPRQMGDVAILLKSRFSEWETILSNGIVNLISLLGVLMGLYSNDLSPETKQYALVFVAGNFIYIASDIWKNLFRHTSLWVNALEMVGLLLGVALTLQHNHSH